MNVRRNVVDYIVVLEKDAVPRLVLWVHSHCLEGDVPPRDLPLMCPGGELGVHDRHLETMVTKFRQYKLIRTRFLSELVLA